ncbi:MAG: DUF423 domain-containing protein [Chromatiales bacterium]|nr:DUF423 domain-containing protein [Chromatiales bacterium]
MSRVFLFLGAINGFLAVGLGAFGAHGLRQRLDAAMLEVFRTGVDYHAMHALALLAVGLMLAHMPQSTPLKWAGWAFVLGIVLFSGSLYALSITGTRGLGIVTPFGGILFLIGWALLAVSAVRS